MLFEGRGEVRAGGGGVTAGVGEEALAGGGIGLERSEGEVCGGGKEFRVRWTGEGGRGEPAEDRVAGEGEVECVDGIDAEELADQESAAFAVKVADLAGFVESGEEGIEGTGVEMDVGGERWCGKGFRAEHVDIATWGVEHRVVGVELAVACGDAAQGRVGGFR